VIAIARVLLTTTVDRLGHVGEVVDVADGYARNFLFPRKLAVPPSEHNVARFAKQRAAHEAEMLAREEKARRLRGQLADATLVFVRKVHDVDQLYGSVRAEEIVAQIADRFGEAVEASRIELDRPIERLGPHAVRINLYRDISAEVRVRVDEEGTQEE